MLKMSAIVAAAETDLSEAAILSLKLAKSLPHSDYRTEFSGSRFLDVEDRLIYAFGCAELAA